MTTAVRVRSTPGGRDPNGDPIDSTETRAPIPDAFLGSPQSSDIDTTGRDGVTVAFRLYMRHGFDLVRTDEVEVDGDLFRIVGEVQRRDHPMTGWKPGQWCAIARAEG